MPRIDPLQLLDCLNVLLSPTGGILNKNEVHRLASLMTKFSKKLVSKCIYVLILKNTDVNLLGLFMGAGGWTLIHLWLNDAVFSFNWALLKELLELLLITPVDVERLKSNNIPKLVKSLSKREELSGIYELSNQLVQLWLKIVKDETQGESSSNQRKQPEVVAEDPPQDEDQAELVDDEQAVEEVVENEECDAGINSQTFYKLTLKDGKHLISKVGATDANFQILENVEVVELKDDDEVKDKEKKKEKRKSHDRSKHKSSSKSSSDSSSSNSRDKEKSSRRDKSKHSSSSKDRDKDRSRDKNKHDKSKDKDRHRNNGSISKSNSSSSSSKYKDKRDNKEKQAEKDKDTLSKIQPSAIQKLPKIPKKSYDDKDKSKESKKDDSKRGSISVEVRKNNEERPKTVKVYKSKMRLTGLEEEAKPAPPRPTKKPGSTPPMPTTPVPSLKRPSPIRDINVVPPEKKTKIEPPVERPGSIKLIPPKPKPAVLQESDMFMDALTASATTKKEPKKRKRRASVSKESSGTSPPSSPSPKEAVASLKNLSPPKFYQDTLETEETKQENSESPNIANDDEINLKETEADDTAMEVTPRVPTPVEDTTEEEPSRTKTENGLKGVLVYVKRKGPKKSIKWKPDNELVDIKLFELDETERVNVTKTFGDLAKMDVISEREALQMSRKLQNKDVMSAHTEWRIPFEIDLPEPLAPPGSKSLEKDIQFAREKSVLQDLYFNKRNLLETPAEPDPEMFQVKDPIVIPVDAADNPDQNFTETPWPEPKGSPPPPPIVQNNVNALFPNVQGPFNNFPMGVPVPPNFQNMQNIQNVQPFQAPPFIQQNVMGGSEWNNVNMSNMHNPQIMPRNMPPPEMMNQGMLNPNMFIPPQDNFNPMVNDNNHRFPGPFNQQGPGPGPGMYQNNFNRGGFRRGGGGGGGGLTGPWVRMNTSSPGNWNMRNGGGPHRGGGRVCHHFRNKGFCKNGDNCPFLHPNS